jgi:hypothetical protein
MPPPRERPISGSPFTAARELRHAARALARTPGYTITCIAVLALAIGVNTAMFGVLSAVLLRPLPYEAPNELAMLWAEIPARGQREGRLAFGDIEELRSRSRAFQDVAVYDPVSVTLTDADGAERIGVARASPNLFSLLGVRLERGRPYSAEEAEQRRPVALLSHRFWLARFGASNDALGATLELDGISTTIVGVLPADFQLDGSDVWEPHTSFADWETRRVARGGGSWLVVGRLTPNVAFAEAQAEVSAIARNLDTDAGAAGDRRIGVVPLSRQVAGPETRRALWAIAAAVLAVLLIAVTNVAGLALARAAARTKDLGIRAALGANRMRLVAGPALEGLCVAGAAGLGGLVVAAVATRLVLAFGPSGLARLSEARIDVGALGWAFGLCVLAAVVVGVVPGVAMSRGDAELLVRQSGRGDAGNRGVRRGGRAVVEERAALHAAVLDQVEPLPGVLQAALIGDFFVGAAPERAITTERAASADPEVLRVRVDEASPAFIETLGARLQRGRSFDDADGLAGQRVAIVNEAMAERLWPGEDPIGRRFKLGPANSPDAWRTVVGVVGDMRRQGLENEPIPQMFEPLAQNPSRLETLLVRTSTDEPLSMLEVVREAVHRVTKSSPVYGATTLEDRVAGFLAPRRFQTSLLIGFSAVALAMAAIGIYGLISYTVALRTREISIRIAAGARGSDIVRLFVGEGLTLCFMGLAIGLAGALTSGRAASSLLFGVGAGDPLTLAAVSGLLVAVAVAACYFPARRAARVEPLTALRQE